MLVRAPAVARSTSGAARGRACGPSTVSVIGVDLSLELLRHAGATGPVVQARLPDLSWVRSSAVDRVVSVGLLDLIADHERFFVETARVVRHGGHLVVVINHPVVTAPDSAPLVDPDGEILWRWGTYLTPGTLPITSRTTSSSCSIGRSACC